MKPAAHPLGAVHVTDRRSERDPKKDLLGDGPPPDPKTGLTEQEAIVSLEDAAREEKRRLEPAQGVPGAFNHPATRAPADKCGAKYGRCFGDIIAGRCQKCGADYTRTTPLGGVNGTPVA